jgi:hypothetical protein
MFCAAQEGKYDATAYAADHFKIPGILAVYFTLGAMRKERTYLTNAADGHLMLVMENFGFLSALKVRLILRFKYGFRRKGKEVRGFGEAIYRDLVRGGLLLKAGQNDLVGITLHASSEESDAFLREFASRHAQHGAQMATVLPHLIVESTASTSELLCVPFLDNDTTKDVEFADAVLAYRGYPKWTIRILRRIFSVGLWTQGFVWEEWYLDLSDVLAGYGLLLLGLGLISSMVGVVVQSPIWIIAGAILVLGFIFIALAFWGWRRRRFKNK